MLFRKISILSEPFYRGSLAAAKKNALKIIQGLLKNNDASLRALSNGCIDKRAPSTFSRFLFSSSWNPYEVNLARIRYSQSLKQLKTVPGGVISLDDTISKKHGKELQSAGYHYSHTENKVVLGQNIVALHYKDDKKEYGLNYRVYLNKKSIKKLKEEGNGADIEFQTRIEMACDMLKRIHENGIRGQTITMDAWFPSKDLITLISELGYHWVGRVKSNRVCYNAEGGRISIKELGASIPDKYWQKSTTVYETAEVQNQPREQYIVSKIIHLRTLGKVKMVFVRPSLEENIVLFVGTDRFDLGAREILELYAKRWSIETFFRDCKQNLAFSEYMGRSYIGFERFLCLVFTAYSFIKYLSLTGFWGKNDLPRGKTFGAELNNYHQLCFEYFISVIYEVSQEIDDKKNLLIYIRNHYYNGTQLSIQLPDDHMFYDLRAHILAAVG